MDILGFNPSANPTHTPSRPVYAQGGMVAASQPLAAAAGLRLLLAGGNAVDAAIAAAAALTVVEPTSNGIGSDAFAICLVDGKLYGLNSSGPAPRSISCESVAGLGHTKMPTHGVLPITVPGTPAAWATLNARFGSKSLSMCLAPAVEYARGGYPASPVLSESWAVGFRAYSKSCTSAEFAPWFSTFAPSGKTPIPGEIVRLPFHADTLQELGETDCRSFYQGVLAKKVVDFVASNGGFLTSDDLWEYAPEWVEPISAQYRGVTVHELPPNSQGIVALIALKILEGVPFCGDPAQDLHNQFEAMKLAMICGKNAITDPRYAHSTAGDLLDDDFIAKLRAQISDRAFVPAPVAPKTGGTVYLCTADRMGNMVSFIQSNYMGFGSGIVIPETGIAMQNRGADFSLDMSHANALQGGKRSYHTLMPGFVTHEKSAGPFGIMGGYMQPQAHVQVISNIMDMGLNPQAALDFPRWIWQQELQFYAEANHAALLPETHKQLRTRGHVIDANPAVGLFGRGQMILRAGDVLVGATEWRTDGMVAAY